MREVLTDRRQGALMTASERVREALRDRILSRELEPGARLTLSAIAQEYGVSPTPVRDALRELEKERLVEGRAMMGYQVAKLDTEEFIGLWNLREAVECQTARLCAQKATKLQLAEIEELARETDEVREQPPTPISYERETRFHRRVAEIAGCRELTDTLDRVHALIGTYCRPWVHVGPTHLELAQEIASGDLDRAERAMRGHVMLKEGDLERLAAKKG